MKKFFKILGIVLLGIFLLIQLIPKNYPENKPVDGNDILAYHEVPEDIGTILKTSCYDCHSNQINYPWYSKIAPVSFLIRHDIEEGKSELNFSEWGTFEKKRMIKKLDELTEEVGEGKMPLPIYLITHGNASLSEEQKEKLDIWAEGLMEQILGE